VRDAIILHGKPDRASYDRPDFAASTHNWYPWLKRSLRARGVAAETPEIPDAWKPDYATWKAIIERYGPTPETLLVGHSCGGGFLLRWLSEQQDARVGKVVLVAPWIDPERAETTDFFDFTMDGDLAGRTKGVVIFYSDNDVQPISESVRMIRETLKEVRCREFRGYGHFSREDLKGEEFPELLEECLR
jgi:predicted alpha/beta hydrolase family esterase